MLEEKSRNDFGLHGFAKMAGNRLNASYVPHAVLYRTSCHVVSGDIDLF
jgi:hypothetical protein